MIISGIIFVLLVITLSVLLARSKDFGLSLGNCVIIFIAVMGLALGVALIRESGNGKPASQILDEGAVYLVRGVYDSSDRRLAIIETTSNKLLFVDIPKRQVDKLDVGKYYVAASEEFKDGSQLVLKDFSLGK